MPLDRYTRVVRVAITAALACVAVLPARLEAQSDILLQLRSGNPTGDRVRVDSSGGLVALGEIGQGIIPASGAGYRMMWYPFKTAFRAGWAELNEFDDANIGFFSWAGGSKSVAAAVYSFAFGSNSVVESGAQAGIAIGANNKIFGSGSTLGNFGVALGIGNKVMDNNGIAIGQANTSNGNSAVALGYTSSATGDYSMAFGYRASTAGFTGAKVFSDFSATDSALAIANNEFAVRAAGGFRFRTGSSMTTTGCNLPAGSGAFTCSSSRTFKNHFDQMNGEDVLRRIATMPIMKWSYINEPGAARHVGPFAEDFHAAFGLGSDDKAIGLLDISGINLLAVQALEKRTAELAAARASSEQLAGRVTQLESTNAELLKRLDRLEAALANTRQAP